MSDGRVRRIAAGLLVVSLFAFAACSDEPSGTTGGPGVAAEPTQPADRKGSVSDEGRGKERAPKGERSGENDGKKGASSEGSLEDGNGSAGTQQSSGSSGAATAVYPAPGEYVYAQSGYEEFCQTTSCEKEDLPPKQTLDLSHKRSDKDEAVVVAEARASYNRYVRTTFHFDRQRAVVTDVYTRFDYENLSFEDSYHPQPPVEVTRFPLRSGTSWSGRWKDRTSGRYEVSVQGREEVRVAGSTVDAFRIATDIEFSGQFDGSSSVLVWFDPSTKMIVKSEGDMDLRSAFGRYRTEFALTLDSGPGF